MNTIKYQALFRPRNRFLRFLRADVACQGRRLLSTAAARDIPVVARRTGKRIPKAERKAMVEAYVNKYRGMNAGKFPGVTNTMKQVGGSCYTIRAILQELEYNSKLSVVATVDRNSTVGQMAQGNVLFEVEDITDCSRPAGQTIEAKQYGVVAENVFTCLRQRDKITSQRMVDMSTLTKFKEFAAVTAEDVPQKMVNSELERQGDSLSAAAVARGVNNRFLQSRESIEEPQFAEVSPDRSVKALAIEDFEFCEKAGHPSEITGTLRRTDLGETNNISVQASESDEFTRVLNAAKIKKQFGGSKLHVTDTVNKNPMLRKTAEASGISEVGEIADHQVPVDRTSIADNQRISAEIGSTSQEDVGANSSQRKEEVSVLIKTNEITTIEVSATATAVGLELGRSSTNEVDRGDKIRFLNSREVLEKSRTGEKALTDVKASAMDSKFPAKTSCPFQVLGGVINTEIGEVDKTSAIASKYDEALRGTALSETQDNDLRKQSLWRNLKSIASNFLSIWRKT